MINKISFSLPFLDSFVHQPLLDIYEDNSLQEILSDFHSDALEFCKNNSDEMLAYWMKDFFQSFLNSFSSHLSSPSFSSYINSISFSDFKKNYKDNPGVNLAVESFFDNNISNVLVATTSYFGNGNLLSFLFPFSTSVSYEGCHSLNVADTPFQRFLSPLDSALWRLYSVLFKVYLISFDDSRITFAYNSDYVHDYDYNYSFTDMIDSFVDENSFLYPYSKSTLRSKLFQSYFDLKNAVEFSLSYYVTLQSHQYKSQIFDTKIQNLENSFAAERQQMLQSANSFAFWE